MYLLTGLIYHISHQACNCLLFEHQIGSYVLYKLQGFDGKTTWKIWGEWKTSELIYLCRKKVFATAKQDGASEEFLKQIVKRFRKVPNFLSKILVFTYEFSMFFQEEKNRGGPRKKEEKNSRGHPKLKIITHFQLMRTNKRFIICCT